MNNTIYPCLWFDGEAKAAADFYCTVFKESKITADTSIVVNFELFGQKFMALNGGPKYKVNPSISFFVVCGTEIETDDVWKSLSDGGTVMMALDKYPWSEKYGWVQDRFDVSWQISLGKMSDVGQKFTPLLMFAGEQHGRAEEAINFYTSVFDHSSVNGILKYKAGEDDKEGTVKHGQFRINNYVLMAMDSGFPHAFSFNEGISLVVTCDTQEEIDHYWNRFTEDGEESRCGWLKDKFGISWQIVPAILGKLMSEPGKGERVVKAFLQMRKFDIEKLKQA